MTNLTEELNKTNKKTKTSSLGRLIFSTLSITISIALLILFFAFVAYDQTTFQQSLEEKLNILAKVTAENTQAAVSFEDEQAAHSTLKSLSAYQHIWYAAIADENKKVLVDFHYKKQDKSKHTLASNGIIILNNFMHITTPIILKEHTIGTLYIKADMIELTERRSRFLFIGISVLLFVLILSLIIANKLVIRIINPIYNLSSLAKLISKENDYSLKAQKSSVEEINTLVVAFNHMLEEIKQHQARLISSEQRLSLALVGGGEGTWDWDLKSKITYFDSYSCNILGLEKDQTSLPQNEWSDWIFEEDIVRVRKYIKYFFDHQKTDFKLEYRVKNRGRIFWLHLAGKVVSGSSVIPSESEKSSISPVSNDHFKNSLSKKNTFSSRIIGVMRDISEQKESQEKIKLLATVFDHTSDAVVILDTHFRVLTINHAFSQTTHFERSEIIGSSGLFLDKNNSAVQFEKNLKKKCLELKHWHGEAIGKKKSGEKFPIELELNTVYDNDNATHFVAVFSDITLRKKNEEEMFFMANYDALTKLPNRIMFHSVLQKSLNNAKRNNGKLAVLFIDLDRFKQVNDTLGHDAGDELLKQAAQRMLDNIRETDSVYRLSGDEFTIILESLKHERNAENIAKKIRSDFQREFNINNKKASIGTSIGISIYPNDADKSEELLKHADTAMYFAKTNGRNNYSFFDNKMNSKAERRNTLEIELRKALSLNQIFLCYQPKVDSHTFEIMGFEALARWHHPDLGAISPSEFIPIAEESGLIEQIGIYIFREACLQLKKWHQLGYKNINMAINVSAREFQLSDYALNVAKILDQIKIDPIFIELELTESLVMENPDKTILMLDVLKNLNLSLSIDDFGTGYSSLSYLRSFPLDVLKVDQSFVRELGENKDGLAITAAIISMAHNLGLKVIAEGVETNKQLSMLQELKCELIQGYLFSTPLTPAKAEEQLNQQKFSLKII
ncbi:MAG: diguanylate cyclase (GGDEF)-like protein/PAS domain S-box-containing protein [Oceanicoccus sp.]|jgi:diguanylate cyclase (GGDEF)-like protein/PAS domain S-box-containing protein